MSTVAPFNAFQNKSISLYKINYIVTNNFINHWFAIQEVLFIAVDEPPVFFDS